MYNIHTLLLWSLRGDVISRIFAGCLATVVLLVGIFGSIGAGACFELAGVNWCLYFNGSHSDKTVNFVRRLIGFCWRGSEMIRCWVNNLQDGKGDTILYLEPICCLISPTSSTSEYASRESGRVNISGGC